MQFVRWSLTWENESGTQSAEFCLPISEDPHIAVGSLLNLADLDASECGYGYELNPQPVDNSRESLDAYQAHLLQRIKDSKEPIQVRGIFHKSE